MAHNPYEGLDDEINGSNRRFGRKDTYGPDASWFIKALDYVTPSKNMPPSQAAPSADSYVRQLSIMERWFGPRKSFSFPEWDHFLTSSFRQFLGPEENLDQHNAAAATKFKNPRYGPWMDLSTKRGVRIPRKTAAFVLSYIALSIVNDAAGDPLKPLASGPQPDTSKVQTVETDHSGDFLRADGGHNIPAAETRPQLPTRGPADINFGSLGGQTL